MSASVHPRWTANETPHARIVALRSPYRDLTARETEVLRAVCVHGIPGATDALYVETTTIKNILTGVYRKLGIGGRGNGKLGLACYRLGGWDNERSGEP